MNETLFAALQKNNIPLPDNVKTHGFTRWGKNFRYWAIRLDLYNFAFGDWNCGFRDFAFQNTKKEHTPQQLAKLTLCLKQEQERERQRIENQQKCRSILARRLWDSLPPAPESHPYLLKKGVMPHGIKWQESNNTLKIPLYDADSTMWNLQSIDANSEKRFMAQARKKGCFHTIGEIVPTGKIVICEGFATGASIHEATGLAVAVSFDAGNLDPVAAELVRKYPNAEIIIAGDNDHEKDFNTGKVAAISAARRLGLSVIIPAITAAGQSDFNDIHKTQGLDAVREQFNKGNIL